MVAVSFSGLCVSNPVTTFCCIHWSKAIKLTFVGITLHKRYFCASTTVRTAFFSRCLGLCDHILKSLLTWYLLKCLWDFTNLQPWGRLVTKTKVMDFDWGQKVKGQDHSKNTHGHICTLRGIYHRSLECINYFNELYYHYSILGSHNMDDIFKVTGSKVKVTISNNALLWRKRADRWCAVE